MAGIRQHHVWQLIQRGFAQEGRPGFWVWRYERGKDPVEVTTKSYGTAINYFTIADDTSADDFLTRFENKAQKTIQRIRQLPDNTPIESNEFAPIVTHFEMRSLFLREEISRIGERALHCVDAVFSQARNRQRIYRKLLEAPGAIENMARDAGFSERDGQIIRALHNEIPAHLIKFFSSQEFSELDAILFPLRIKILEKVKSAHASAIKKGFKRSQRTDAHMKLRFFTRRTREDVLLPDTGLAFLEKDKIWPITTTDRKIDEVIVPLDARTLVIGSRSTPIQRTEDSINKILATCSYESFISRSNSQKLLKLASAIGKNAKLYSEREIREIFDIEALLQSI